MSIMIESLHGNLARPLAFLAFVTLQTLPGTPAFAADPAPGRASDTRTETRTEARSSAASTRLDSPVGGWRAGDATRGFVQEVHYPAVRVNVAEGTALSAQIRGRIAAAAKISPAPSTVANGAPPPAPATLIVNGVALPLDVGEDGSFARPYAFAAGSNSVELRAPGRPARRVQFYDTGGGTRARLRIVLSWDTPGTDLDLHVVTPAGGHAWYGERVLGEGGALDVDVTDGYGPEIFASPTPAAGVWHVFVNYFGGGGDSALSVAQVSVIEGEGTAGETRREFRIPLRSSGDLQHVVSFGVL